MSEKQYEGEKFETKLVNGIKDVADLAMLGVEGWEVKATIGETVILQRLYYEPEDTLEDVKDACGLCDHFEGAYKNPGSEIYIKDCHKLGAVVNQDSEICKDYERIF